MFMIVLILLCQLSVASRYEISETTTIESGEHIPVSYVEYMSTTTKKNMFHMNFKENDITFDLTIQGEGVDKDNFYFIAVKTDDFVVSCSRSKTIGTVTELESNKISIVGQIITEEEGLFAAYLCSSSADGNNGQQVSIVGTITFKNQHGYIKTGYFGFIPFSTTLSCLYVTLVIYWMVVAASNKNSLQFYHKVFSVMLCVCTLDEIVNAYSMILENSFPLESTKYWVVIMERLIHAFRASFVRYVGLMISYGWGMATKVVEEQKYFKAFGILYFMLTFFTNQYQADINEGNFLQKTILILQCLMDAMFGSMVVGRLSDLVQDLEERSEQAKASFYKKLSMLVKYSIMMGFVFAGLSILYLQTSWRLKSYKKLWWFSSGCWRFEFAFVVGISMFLFKPNRGSEMYVTGKQLPMEVDEFDNDINSDEFSGNMRTTTLDAGI